MVLAEYVGNAIYLVNDILFRGIMDEGHKQSTEIRDPNNTLAQSRGMDQEEVQGTTAGIEAGLGRYIM
jgi:hypothetical protein